MDNLTDIEKVKIETFCADELMYEAVKKGLLAIMYGEGVIGNDKVSVRNTAFNLIANSKSRGENVSNEELGENLRALFEGVDALENGLAKLKKISTKIESPYNEENEAI